jgi:hypothetical protein
MTPTKLLGLFLVLSGLALLGLFLVLSGLAPTGAAVAPADGVGEKTDAGGQGMDSDVDAVAPAGGAGEKTEQGGPRYFVFWCGDPRGLKNATHITPQVWAGGDAAAKRKYGEFPQEFWLRRGVTPLRWRGGRCYKEKSEDEFVAYWSAAADQGYKGIAIDEFGYDRGGEVDRKMARALVRTRQKAPGLFIAVWQTRRLSNVVLEAYREAADLVMLEIYAGEEFEEKFDEGVAEVRNAGILHKTVLALGIDDRAPAAEQRERGRWANSKAVLEAQVRWIRTHAPEMPGVAFFAPRASAELVHAADELCERHFPRPGH